MNAKALFVALAAATLTLAAHAQGPAPVLTAEDANAWLDGFVPYALATGDIAGAEVAIVKDGAVVTERGYGFANVEKRAPVDPKVTMFRPDRFRNSSSGPRSCSRWKPARSISTLTSISISTST